MADKEKVEFYAPPPKRSISERISNFLWNSEEKEFLGRTAASWAKILIFYIIFYIVLAIFWASMWVIFDKIAIKTDQPRWKLKESLIGSNPGLGFRPMPSDDFVDSALIWFKISTRGYSNWTEQTQTFLKPYHSSEDPDIMKNRIDCSYDMLRPSNKVCRLPIDLLGRECSPPYFSYDKGTPCVFLKLNKIYDWIPEFYNNTNALPPNMPKSLREKIVEVSKKNIRALNTIWISCEGENAADKEHIGQINMYPYHGFAGYYFPFSNIPGYMSPLVAVHFQNPTRGVLINIECKAWAKNIIYDRHDRRGSVHFELMVDN